MNGLALLREEMTRLLTARGIEAVSAWPGDAARRGPLAVVRLKKLTAAPAGLQGYLGQVETGGLWQERHGQALTVTFGLTLYAPEHTGESGCRDLLDAVAEVLLAGGPAGLAVEEWSADAPAFDAKAGLFRAEVAVRCRAVLLTEEDEDGGPVDFELQGRIER